MTQNKPLCEAALKKADMSEPMKEADPCGPLAAGKQFNNPITHTCTAAVSVAAPCDEPGLG